MYLCLKKFSFQSAPDISSATQIQAYRPDEPSVCNLCQQGKIYRCINFGHIQKMIPFHNMLDKIWKHTVKKFLIVTHVRMIGPLAKEKPAEGAVTFIWLLQKVPLLVQDSMDHTPNCEHTPSCYFQSLQYDANKASFIILLDKKGKLILKRKPKLLQVGKFWK